MEIKAENIRRGQIVGVPFGDYSGEWRQVMKTTVVGTRDGSAMIEVHYGDFIQNYEPEQLLELGQ